MSRAPQHTPSAFAVQRALTELHDARERLLAIDPDIQSDGKLLLDSLEGMTDAFEVVDRLVEASLHADMLAKGARASAAAIAERAKRFEHRREALRSMVLGVMQTLEQDRLERSSFTVSVQQNEPELNINEAELPDAYFRIKREVDRAAVRKALVSGTPVRGAKLGNAAQGIRVKV